MACPKTEAEQPMCVSQVMACQQAEAEQQACQPLLGLACLMYAF